MLAQKDSQSRVAQPGIDDSAALTSALHRDHLTIDRLIVLVPNRGLDSLTLARAVWNLTQPCHIPVMYVALSGRSAEDDIAARMRLTTLAAMTRDDDVQVDTHIEAAESWTHAVHEIWKAGDAVVCMAEHKVPLRLGGEYPLWQVLECLLDVPVYVLPGIYNPQGAAVDPRRDDLSHTLKTLSRLLVPLVIVGSFFLMQLRIGSMTAGFSRVEYLGLSGLVEVGLIGAWRVLGH